MRATVVSMPINKLRSNTAPTAPPALNWKALPTFLFFVIFLAYKITYSDVAHHKNFILILGLVLAGVMPMLLFMYYVMRPWSYKRSQKKLQ